MAKEPSLLIWINRRTLLDRSEVFEVEFGDETIPCIAEGDAEELAQGIKRLIDSHSNMTAGVMYG